MSSPHQNLHGFDRDRSQSTSTTFGWVNTYSKRLCAHVRPNHNWQDKQQQLQVHVGVLIYTTIASRILLMIYVGISNVRNGNHTKFFIYVEERASMHRLVVRRAFARTTLGSSTSHHTSPIEPTAVYRFLAKKIFSRNLELKFENSVRSAIKERRCATFETALGFPLLCD